MQKLHLSSKREVTIRCPSCGYTKVLTEARVPAFDRPIKITCKCGHPFGVTIDRRTNYRKKVNLKGTFKGTEVTVTDVSTSGIRFELKHLNIRVRPEDRTSISFVLDNDDRSVLEMELEIVDFKDKSVGARFTDMDVHTKKVLGFYLFP